MPDIATLLDRTTPDDLAPLDVRTVVRRSRRRRARRRAVAASATAVAVVLAGTMAVTILGGRGGAPSVTMPVTGPDGRPLVEPVGAWHQGGGSALLGPQRRLRGRAERRPCARVGRPRRPRRRSRGRGARVRGRGHPRPAIGRVGGHPRRPGAAAHDRRCLGDIGAVGGRPPRRGHGLGRRFPPRRGLRRRRGRVDRRPSSGRDPEGARRHGVGRRDPGARADQGRAGRLAGRRAGHAAVDAGRRSLGGGRRGPRRRPQLRRHRVRRAAAGGVGRDHRAVRRRRRPVRRARRRCAVRRRVGHVARPAAGPPGTNPRQPAVVGRPPAAGRRPRHRRPTRGLPPRRLGLRPGNGCVGGAAVGSRRRARGRRVESATSPARRAP